MPASSWLHMSSAWSTLERSAVAPDLYIFRDESFSSVSLIAQYSAAVWSAAAAPSSLMPSYIALCSSRQQIKPTSNIVNQMVLSFPDARAKNYGVCCLGNRCMSHTSDAVCLEATQNSGERESVAPALLAVCPSPLQHRQPLYSSL